MNINTISIKEQQLTNGYFQTGSGKEKVLIMGSCRVCPYVQYLDKWNNENGNRFTIYSIDPFNLNWDIDGNRVDVYEVLKEMESHEGLALMLRSVDIFVHEWYQNLGMFNTLKNGSNNIYDHGMSPKEDICIPSFNDLFILFSDIVTFDTQMNKKCIQDFNVNNSISEQTQKELYDISIKNIDRFYEVCRKSDIPEMELYFKVNFLEKRFFHNFNHVSKHFTLQIFKYIYEKFLKLELSKQFIQEISSYDMYDNRYTELTDLDIKWHGYNWNENIKPFIDKIK